MADIVVIHGAPGAGKSTHCRNLAQFRSVDKDIFHISAGDRLRAIRTGEFVSVFSDRINSPDASSPLDHGLVSGVIFEFVSECPKNSIVLVDGFPRFTDAIGIFMNMIEAGDHSLLGCISLNVSRQTSVTRISGRGIRKGERIIAEDYTNERFSDYLNVTAESINAFRQFSRVIDVNAEPQAEVVWEFYKEAFQELIGRNLE
jgi:adenylate kinase family enzyme